MIRKELGKIQSIRFGMGGYQDTMIGIRFDLGGNSWGVSDFWGYWAEHSQYCKWTQAEQKDYLGETVLKINCLLKEANKTDINKLVGVPVEIEFENNTLKSWRILTEVI